MMNKVNQLKHIVDQLILQGNLDVVDVAFSADYIAHAGDKTYKGQKFVKQFTRQVRVSIPDINILKIEILSQVEDMITWQRTFSGTHKADMQGIPASMKKVTWYEIVVTRFKDETIAEEWVASDLAAQLLLKQRTK